MAGRSHAEARAILVRAWERSGIAVPPTRGALQIAAGVGMLESGYGTACYVNKNTGVSRCDTNNWGAVQGQSNDASKGKVGGFRQTDFDALKGKQFEAFYQLYATPEDGAAHMLGIMASYALPQMLAGDVNGTSTEMYIGRHRGGTLHDPRGYFGGFHRLAGLDGEDRRQAALANIEAHAAKVAQTALAVSTALQEPMDAVRGMSPIGGVPPDTSDPTRTSPNAPSDPRTKGARGEGILAVFVGLFVVGISSPVLKWANGRRYGSRGGRRR